MDHLVSMSVEEAVLLGYLVIVRRKNYVSYRPTDKYKETMNPANAIENCIVETAAGDFLVEGKKVSIIGEDETVKLLGEGQITRPSGKLIGETSFFGRLLTKKVPL
jgi:hypothetical protein